MFNLSILFGLVKNVGMNSNSRFQHCNCVFLEFLDVGSIGVFGFICYGLARRFIYVIVFFAFVIMC